VRVFFTAEYMQLAIHAPAQGTLRQHALDGELKRPLGVLLEQLAERNALQIAHLACVLVIELVGELGTRDTHVAGIDDHNMVADILMRSIGRLVLTLEPQGDFGG
jgi:hypothetical protein